MGDTEFSSSEKPGLALHDGNHQHSDPGSLPSPETDQITKEIREKVPWTACSGVVDAKDPLPLGDRSASINNSSTDTLPLEKWNQSSRNVIKYCATLVSFVVMGMFRLGLDVTKG